FFFFSSRRRHTRFSRDWSSDVCSSDLTLSPQASRRPYGTDRYEPKAPASDYTGVYYNPEIQTEYRITERDGQLYLSHKRISDVRSEERRVGKSVELGGRRGIAEKRDEK